MLLSELALIMNMMFLRRKTESGIVVGPDSDVHFLI